MEDVLTILDHLYTLLEVNVYLVVQSISYTTSSCNTSLLLLYFYILVVIFRPRITSAPMAIYIFFCNSTVLYCRYILRAYLKLDGIIGTTTLTLSAIWSFDALLFVSPPLCLSEHLDEFFFNIPLLEFLATVYVLVMTYGVIKLHMQNFKPLWRLCRICYVGFYRAWDPRSSMIQAFASLFFLSYAKLTFLSGWILLLSGFPPQVLITIVSIFVPGAQTDIYVVSYPVAIFFSVIAILCSRIKREFAMP